MRELKKKKTKKINDLRLHARLFVIQIITIKATTLPNTSVLKHKLIRVSKKINFVFAKN